MYCTLVDKINFYVSTGFLGDLWWRRQHILKPDLRAWCTRMILIRGLLFFKKLTVSLLTTLSKPRLPIGIAIDPTHHPVFINHTTRNLTYTSFIVVNNVRHQGICRDCGSPLQGRQFKLADDNLHLASTCCSPHRLIHFDAMPQIHLTLGIYSLAN